MKGKKRRPFLSLADQTSELAMFYSLCSCFLFVDFHPVYFVAFLLRPVLSNLKKFVYNNLGLRKIEWKKRRPFGIWSSQTSELQCFLLQPIDQLYQKSYDDCNNHRTALPKTSGLGEGNPYIRGEYFFWKFFLLQFRFSKNSLLKI